MNHDALIGHLTARLREVQERLGQDVTASAEVPFAEAVDSMGLVEFIGVIAADCGVGPEVIEAAAGRRFGTIAGLARALIAAQIQPREQARQAVSASSRGQPRAKAHPCWLSDWSTFIPDGRRPSSETDRLLERPGGWMEQHAGIRTTWYWRDQDSLEIAAFMAQTVLRERRDKNLSALLVTGESPHTLVGQAAALHSLVGLPDHVPAIEVGGACLGFLHCVWLGRQIARPGAPVLVVVIEDASRWLSIAPGEEGEAAALFGDAVGVCMVTADDPRQTGTHDIALSVRDLALGTDGRGRSLVRVGVPEAGDAPFAVRMDGRALALRAVQQLAEVIEQVCGDHGLKPVDLEGVYIHAGNGRLPALVARRLGVPQERVICSTPYSGNLGAVSLPAALIDRRPSAGPVALAAVGAGLCWGAALLDVT